MELQIHISGCPPKWCPQKFITLLPWASYNTNRWWCTPRSEDIWSSDLPKILSSHPSHSDSHYKLCNAMIKKSLYMAIHKNSELRSQRKTSNNFFCLPYVHPEEHVVDADMVTLGMLEICPRCNHVMMIFHWVINIILKHHHCYVINYMTWLWN